MKFCILCGKPAKVNVTWGRELDLELATIANDLARCLRHPKQYSDRDIQDKLREFDDWVKASDFRYINNRRKYERKHGRIEIINRPDL